MKCGICHGAAADPVLPGPEWPVVCRRCFARADALDEAAGIGVQLLPPDLDGPSLRVVRPVADLTGRRFGRLTVIARDVVRKSDGPRSAWRVRCDCGSTSSILASRLTRRGVQSCFACSQAANGLRKRKHHRLYDLAKRLGMTVKGLEARIRRGARLDAPPAHPPTRRRAA